MNIKSKFSENKRLRFGLTEVSLKGNTLIVYHGGNMGNTIKHSVNPNLKSLGFPTIEKLKDEFSVIKESGSPDYMYVITFKIK